MVFGIYMIHTTVYIIQLSKNKDTIKIGRGNDSFKIYSRQATFNA